MNVTSRNLCDTCQCLIVSKHAVFARSLFKCTTINYSETTLARLYSTKRDVKRKNYYDLLKITPHATQSEIKSAYYKLSLQYHPDKNESDHAKQKFQDISDAYEILSNHEHRKNYDRHMAIHQPVTKGVKETQHRNQVYTGATKIYNFDAWTQAHYGRQFEKDRLRREKYQDYIKMEKMSSQDSGKHTFVEYILYFLIAMLLIMLYCTKNHDKPIYKEKDIEKSETSKN